jgi:hypothetical protein
MRVELVEIHKFFNSDFRPKIGDFREIVGRAKDGTLTDAALIAIDLMARPSVAGFDLWE